MDHTSPRPIVRANPRASEIFADDLVYMERINGTVRLELATVRTAEIEGDSTRDYVDAGRIVMPDLGAQRLCIYLYHFLKKQGLDPSSLVARGDTKQ